MKRAIGIILMCLGGIVWFVCGMWGFILSVIIVWSLLGPLVVILAVIFFPTTFLIVPWYAGFGLGEWSPLILSYGGVGIGIILYCVGNYIKEESINKTVELKPTVSYNRVLKQIQKELGLQGNDAAFLELRNRYDPDWQSFYRQGISPANLARFAKASEEVEKEAIEEMIEEAEEEKE